MSYDEAIWIWAGQKLFSGADLYQQVIDHKTVFVFGIEGALDSMPGRFELARGIAIGLVIAGIGAMATAVFRELGGSNRASLRVGLITAAVAFVQTELVSTVELWAVTSMLGAIVAITTKRFRSAAGLACLGACIDIRAVLMTPAIALFAYELGGRSALRSFLTTFAPASAVAAIALLASPDARFAVVELATASRLDFHPLDQALVGIRALFAPAVLIPLAAGVAPPGKWSAHPKSGILFLGGAITIAIISRLSFHRYWLFIVLAIPLLAHQLQTPDGTARGRFRPPRVVVIALVVLALLPGALRIIDEALVKSSKTQDGYHRVAAELDRSLSADQSFVHYPESAYLPAFLPEHFTAPSAVLHYYIWETERREQALSQLRAAIDRASVVVDGGQIASEPADISPATRRVLDIFREKAGEFPCDQVIGRITLHWRTVACPSDQIP